MQVVSRSKNGDGPLKMRQFEIRRQKKHGGWLKSLGDSPSRPADWADFAFIRDSLAMSDSALSKQLTLLEGAGYVAIRKGFVGKRPRTWAMLSPAGRRAFEGHVLRLQQIVAESGITLAPQASDPSAIVIRTNRNPYRRSFGTPDSLQYGESGQGAS